MQTKFKNLQTLLDFFKDEETCKAYYEQARWGGNVACPHCGSLKVYRTNRGFKCGEKVCYKKFSITVGTIFENSKIGLRTWFAAMYLCTTSKKGISSLQLAEQLGITQKTAWFVLSRIRTMLAENSNEPLTGTVEIDETFVGGSDINRHVSKKIKRSPISRKFDEKIETPKTVVLGILQRDGNVRTFVVPNTLGATLNPIMRANVETNSRIITDGWKPYRELKDKYNHVPVKGHTGVRSYITYGDKHTNNIEGFWSILKRGIYGIYHQVSPKHLHRYCNEFGYRYNNRQLTGIERFENAVKKVSDTRITYKVLIGK